VVEAHETVSRQQALRKKIVERQVAPPQRTEPARFAHLPAQVRKVVRGEATPAERGENEDPQSGLSDRESLAVCMRALSIIDGRVDALSEAYISEVYAATLDADGGGDDGGEDGGEDGEGAEEVEGEYSDDFEEDGDGDGGGQRDRERSASGNSYEAHEDIAALRAAVEESRQAVAQVEQRIKAAEASEPSREATSKLPFVRMVASIAGVTHEDAEEALTTYDGNLEYALCALAKREAFGNA